MNLQTDRTLIRAAGGSDRHVLLSLSAPEARHAAARPPVNVALAIDRSGSMGGRKIHLAREAAIKALQMLRSTDRFSVVCYDTDIDVIVPSTLATAEAVRDAAARVRALQPRGCTDLAGGWLTGCEQIASHLSAEQIGRCLLLTDGLANHGITDHGELQRRAMELRRRGITTSTFGLGADFNERLLFDMATAGAGHFYYIEEAGQIADALTGELGEALAVVARDVRVRIRPTTGVRVVALNEYCVTLEPDGASVLALGELVSRQAISLAFRLTFPEGHEGATASVLFSVEDAHRALHVPPTDVVWTFATGAENDAQRRNLAVDREVARLYAARAHEEALELNRAGRFDEAAQRLAATARRIQRYAGSDPELLAIVGDLRRRLVEYSAPMSTVRSKAEYFRSKNIARGRDHEGKARRVPEQS
jgi:Ca-activated chloride channel family protein